MKRIAATFLFTILALFFLPACNSGKKSQGFIGRTFNDLAARDNGYFNAKLIMAENEETVWDQQEDNYEDILPVFKYGTQEQASGIQPALDEVMKKTSLVIDLHKKSKWVDDCYFLIGKANFYKRSYDEALTAFQYIISEYPAEKVKGKKKKEAEVEEKSDKEGKSLQERIMHQPVENEASLWVARCMTETKHYDDALTVISVLKSKADFPNWLVGELYAVEADCYIKQRQYHSAITPIMSAIEHTKDKQLKVRYQFILAQLYESGKDYDNAIKQYNAVIDGKAPYEMEFYAKLNVTKLTMANYGLHGTETADELKALLKDEKYIEFYGMIYYTLADLALADNRKEEGIDFLQKSVRTSADDKQKSISYLRLADLYYAEPEYKTAYSYYDSTLTFLEQSFDRYDEIKKLHDGLKLLVEQLDIIETEKKLQYWAGLSEKELEKELAKIIVEEEDTSMQNEIITNQQQQTTAGTEGDFYFYNTALRSRGFSEFKKSWGNRKLEDNWRRSDKGQFDTEETEEKPDSATAESLNLNKKGLTIDDVRESLPKTPEQLAASNARIAAALFNAGMIYKDYFRNNGKAIASFDENVDAYPDNALEPQALYQLYILNTGQKQADYKNKLLEKYPESLYAKIIIDPDYLHAEEKKANAINVFYEQTYDFLQEGNYSEVLLRSKLADSLFVPNPMKPQFEMLSVLTLGNPDSIERFKNELQKLALKYPSQDVGIRAQEILDYLRRGSTMNDVENTPVSINYTYKESEEQYFMFLMTTTGKESTTLKGNIANFNSTHFSTDNLKISSLLFGKENTIILVKSFQSIEKAMVYYGSISEEGSVFEGVSIETITPVVISKSNYVLFFKSKDFDTYLHFFQENYLTDK